jgi:xanthine dehydrogenase accessory factor
MKEIVDIVNAWHQAQKQHLQTALATVVQVEGSSYRQPGARMLITERGELTGAISGGCLEGDALRKAQLVMVQQKPMLVTYDTNDEDDAKLGLGLGCNGIIHILIEPVLPEETNHPITFLEAVLRKRQPAVIATLFSLEERKATQPGTCLLLQEGQVVTRKIEGEVKQLLIKDGQQAALLNESAVEHYGNYTAFVEVVQPAIHVVIAGAGNDVMPVVKMAQLVGWQITVGDGRSNYATPERFPAASCTLMAKPEALLQQVQMDNRTAVLLMTHNYNYDLAMLQMLLPLQPPYIGLLGPKKKKQRLLDELAADGMTITDDMLASLYGPTGLDIGAETAEEIALSIIAEIQAVFSKKSGKMLREKRTPIHQEDW